MKDFKNFKGNNNNNQQPNNVDDAIKAYKGKSQSQLFEELMKQVEKAKQDGTFNKQQLMAFYNKVSPMLSKEEGEKLLALINKL